MIEPDDRLVGDPVWELFPDASPAQPSRPRRFRFWLAVAILIAVSWMVYSPLPVTLACLAASFGDFRTGRRLARSIPDKAGGGICSLFTYAWGAWKFGVAAFVLMFVTIVIHAASDPGNHVPPAFVTAALLWFAGFMGSATMTAAGMVMAYRSGMRVWVGEGVNQARLLLLGMLIVGFIFAVLMPMLLLIAAQDPRASNDLDFVPIEMIVLFGCMLGGPVLILLLLDWFCRRIVADRSGKFGPKVPTVGKWNSWSKAG